VLVFRRDDGMVKTHRGQVLRRVHVTQARSFGNVGVQSIFLTCFKAPTTHHLLDQPIGNIANLKEASVEFPDPVHERDHAASLDRALLRVRDIALQRLQNGESVDDVEIRVAMPAPIDAIPVDKVFYGLMSASEIDALAPSDTATNANMDAVAIRGDG
jgi:hypothetical protein